MNFEPAALRVGFGGESSLPWPCTASRTETPCTQRPPPAWPPRGRSPTPGRSPLRWPGPGRGTPRPRRSSGRPRSPASGGAERGHPGCSVGAWRRAGRGGAAGRSSGSSARRQRTYRGVFAASSGGLLRPSGQLCSGASCSFPVVSTGPVIT